MAIEVMIAGYRLSLATASGLFSPRRVDRGTLFLLSQAELAPGDRLLDLGCGYGVVGLAAARIIGPANVVMVDWDPLAVAYARENANANGIPEVAIIESDGFTALQGREFSVILCNPPYHSDFAVARRLIEGAYCHLIPGGKCLFVVQRRLWYERKFRSVFGGVQVITQGPYHVLRAEKRAGRRPHPRSRPTRRKHAKKLARASAERSR